MCENFVISAQYIRENTYEIGKKLQLATETILGTFEATDRDIQHSLVVPTNRTNNSCERSTRGTTMIGTNELFVEAEYVDSSDSDIDNNYYNDVEEWELPSVKSPKPAPLLASIEFCDTTIISDAATTSDANRAIPCAVVDIDILEENNNDPNNNLDSIQSYQEQENRVPPVLDQIQRAEVLRPESDSLPGCSKDFDEKEAQYRDKKLCEEVEKIHSMLPQFAHKHIWTALLKNRCANNRVLLTLWDLLPNKRPTASHQVLNSGSKFSTDADITFENNEAVLTENKNCNNAAVVMQDITVSSVQDEDEDEDDEDEDEDENENVLLNDDNLKSSSLNAVNSLDFKNFKNTGAVPKCKVTTQSSTAPRILQPAKLMLKLKNDCERNSTNNDKHTELNRYMEYLEYMRNAKNKRNNVGFRNINVSVRNSIRQCFLNSKFKPSNVNISQLIKKTDKITQVAKKSKVLNIANKNSNNDKIFKDKKKVCSLFKCDNEEQCSNDNMSISKSCENLDLSLGNYSTVAACKNSNNVSSCSISSQSSMDTVDAPNDCHTNNIERLIPLDRILTESSTTLSTEQCLNESKPSTDTALTNLSNSSTPTEQASGGEKRKESIQENKYVLLPNVEPIYNTLRSVFEHIDKDFIKNLCSKYYDEHNSTDEMTEDLINYILENNETCPIVVKKDDKRVCKEVISQQVADLSSIFPRADEEYLQKRVKLMNGDQNAITDYIQTQCNKPTYITKEEALRRIKITELRTQYFHNFNAEMFLELFPDPFQHFENVNRQCSCNDEAFDFLKSSFLGLQEYTVREQYKTHKYNLSLTAKALNKLCALIRPDACELNNIYDIPILQECSFILHKVQIRDYMNKIADKEKREYETLKKDEFLECENCYESECLPSKCFTCNDGHIFCKTCIETAVNVEMGKGGTHIKCFSLDCNEEFSCSTLQKALPPTQCSNLLRKKQETEVMAAGLEGLVSCPFCSFASIPPPEDKVFKCLRPDCMKESCRSCKKLSHVPLQCEEIQKKENARLLLEEKMTEALVRKCYSCRKPYIKENGCNKISCSCGAQMCYICEKPITGYTHFNPVSKCPLHSDNYTLHNDTVNAVANETLKHITAKGIKIDESTLLLQNQRTTNVRPEVSQRVHKITNFEM